MRHQNTVLKHRGIGLKQPGVTELGSKHGKSVNIVHKRRSATQNITPCLAG